MCYGLHDFERDRRKVERNTSASQLPVFSWTHSRCGKNGQRLAGAKNADKPVDGRTKQGKELKNAEDTLR